MSGSKARSRVAAKQKVPRIRPAEASAIFKRCEQLLEESRALLLNLRSSGISELLGRMDDRMLQLAIQPDAWGERTRARLMSDIAPALGAEPAAERNVSIEHIVHATNVVMPCLLLEIGRRKQYLQVEFPPNPAASDACFRLSVGPSHPTHSINGDRLHRLVKEAGEALVGLCYFGDEQSRTRLETELSLKPPSKVS